MMDAFEMLQELLAQGQFELILPEAFETAKLVDKLRLVYLMNDAVESFLVFHQVKMTGSYQSDYEGELDASLQKDGDGYVLSVLSHFDRLFHHAPKKTAADRLFLLHIVLQLAAVRAHQSAAGMQGSVVVLIRLFHRLVHALQLYKGFLLCNLPLPAVIFLHRG